jgi:hypothetical protein
VQRTSGNIGTLVWPGGHSILHDVNWYINHLDSYFARRDNIGIPCSFACSMHDVNCHKSFWIYISQYEMTKNSFAWSMGYQCSGCWKMPQRVYCCGTNGGPAGPVWAISSASNLKCLYEERQHVVPRGKTSQERSQPPWHQVKTRSFLFLLNAKMPQISQLSHPKTLQFWF